MSTHYHSHNKCYASLQRGWRTNASHTRPSKGTCPRCATSTSHGSEKTAHRGHAITTRSAHGNKEGPGSDWVEQARPHIPITGAVMRILKVCVSDQFRYCMLRAAACMCFFGILRSREGTTPSQSVFDPSVHLTTADISVNNQASPSAVAIWIKASKKDPFRRGTSVFLSRSASVQYTEIY